ncbi:hypothetical protein FGIG_07056 [Fasciola gigantica]|uniref:Deleted in lung and esophageal cancer protein 1 Ig-like domain-containing protein n=1 Tax=Fasciola gigantica TaxID=46835 RepID=A0A504YE64_FASGI|nr:hypothetical protein FGIG_07056 [Fasciola gigantica]
MTEEDDLTCQNPRPSQAYSQDISCPFSRIFGSMYQKCLLDHDTEAYLKLSRQSDDRGHQDFMQKLEQISLKHDTIQQCINDVEQCIIEKRTSSMVASGTDSDRMINANPLTILSPSNLNADDNKLDCLFEKNGLLSTSDIFFNGKSRRLYSSTNKVKDNQLPVADVKAYGAPKHTTVEKRIKTKAQDDFQNAMKIRFSPKIEEREQLEIEWKKLTAKNNFLKNPRYETEVGKPAHVPALFEAEPKLVTFTSYQVSKTYEVISEIQGFQSHNFFLDTRKFPEQEKNLIAPGMAAIFTIKFAPETLGDYDDALLVEYEAQNRPLVIPIQARRPRPEVNIPDVFNVDYCLVYAPKVVSFELRRSNKSPDADTRFIFITTDTFEQYQNEGLVQFDCGHFHSQFSHSELPFEWVMTEQTLNSDKKGKPTLDNWKTPTPFEDLDETTKAKLFEVHPPKGTLKPDDFTSFELVCSPSKIGNFYAIFKLVLSKVPAALSGSPENLMVVDLEPIEVEVRATVVELPIFLEPNVLILPGKHLLGVPIHRFVKLKNCSDHCPITFCWESETTKSCMTPHSTTTGDYSAWKSGSVAHTPNSTDEILVLFEPVLGEVPPGEEAHIDVCVSSSRVGHFVEKLACHIDCLPGNPLWLHLECEFQAPAMLTDQAEYNLGVVLLGGSICQKVVITNPAPTTRHWKIHIRCGTDLVPSEIITVEPNEGILEPFKSDTLNLRFKPCGKGSVCYFFHLVTEDSTDPVSRLILAEVQTPLLDLSPTTLHLEHLYRSIPKMAVFSLNNLTLLDTDFFWLQVNNCL